MSATNVDDTAYRSLSDSSEEITAQNENAQSLLAHYKPSLWNAAGGMTGTFVWLLFYYAFVELKKGVNLPAGASYPLYIVNALLQGKYANLAAKPFIKKACMAEGETEEEAEKSSAHYAKIYIPVDAQFEPNLDLSIAFAHWMESGVFDFNQMGEPEFSAREIGVMAAMTLLLTSSSHFLMTWYFSGEKDYMESFGKIFILTMAFYFTDAVFDVDFDHDMTALTTSLPNLLGSLLMMGVSYVLVDIFAEKMIALKNKCSSSVTIEEMQDEEKSIGDSQPSTALADPLLQNDSENNRHRFFNYAESKPSAPSFEHVIRRVG